MELRCVLFLFTLFYIHSGVCQKVDIFEAVRKNSERDIRDAIDAGADINAIGPGGQTPLMNAILTGKQWAVHELLRLGASVTIGEKDGYTPMHGAGFQGRWDIIPALVANGLDPSDQHRDGFMPIHRACWGGEQRHTNTVRELLDIGVPYDQAAKNGQTPLDAAKRSGNTSTIKLLEEWAAKAAKDGKPAKPAKAEL